MALLVRIVVQIDVGDESPAIKSPGVFGDRQKTVAELSPHLLQLPGSYLRTLHNIHTYCLKHLC